MKTTFIYSLCDPDDNTVKYVGKANNPKSRYYMHLYDKSSNSYKTKWIMDLKSQNKLPKLQILEEVDISSWQDAEKKWIAHFKSIIGSKLINIRSGGNGGDTGNGIFMERRNIYLTDKQDELLLQEIKDTGLKLSELVRRIFDEHFNKKEK